jgi:hypothetical protein
MGHHARALRRLTTLPGKPTTLVCCHPVKNASNENLLPRGGGSFVAEMDGNLCCQKSDRIVDLHWQGKFRGPDFAPIGFQLATVTCDKLQDTKGRLVPTVTAKPLTETLRTELHVEQRRDEDALLVLLNTTPGGSIASLAEALGWQFIDGRPARSRVQRALKRLKDWQLIKPERGNDYALTEKGKTAAKKAG